MERTLITHRIVAGLATLTAAVQSSGKENSNYRSPERGLFVFEVSSKSTSEELWLIDLIREAAGAGFLILKESGPKRWCFRVHNSLAPFYHFSYRGAYYETPLETKDLLDLAHACEADDYHKKLRKVINQQLAGKPNETPLFDMNQHEN